MQSDQPAPGNPSEVFETISKKVEFDSPKISQPAAQPEQVSLLSEPPQEAPILDPPLTEDETVVTSQDTLAPEPEPDISETSEQPSEPVSTRIVIQTIEINQ
jgi:hypothetical protein